MYYPLPNLPKPYTDAAPPADSPPPAVPVITRHPLPPGGAGPVVRFVVVVFLVTSLSVTLARVFGYVWPGLGIVLLLAGVALLLAAGVKWLWVGRTTRVPMLSAVAVLGAVALALGVLNAGGPLGLLGNMALMMVLFAAFMFIPAAWWLDGVTSTLDAKTTAALAGGFVLLAGVAVIPLELTDFCMLGAITLIANEALALSLMVTYAGYVLANPVHPQDTVRAANEKLLNIFLFRDRDWYSPLLQTGTVFVVAIVVAFGAAVGWFAPPAEAQPPAEAPAPGPRQLDEGTAAFLGWTTVVVVVYVLALGWLFWKLRRPIGGALSVWLLYPDHALPVVYRPHGWLASVRARRVFLAAVVVLNVALVRGALGLIDAGIVVLVLQRGPFPADVSETVRWQLAQYYVGYFVSLFIPLLLPAVLLAGHTMALRTLHRKLEENTPAASNPTPEG